MEAAKLLATRVLSRLGFQVEEIPVHRGRSADLRIADDASVYHIEVKEKFESVEQAKRRTVVLSEGDIYEQADPLAHDNTISGILANARRQLDETPKAPGTFQLIWFHADGIDADLKYRQAFDTFYGQVPLIALKPRQRDTINCFYFDYSASFTMPTIEALILTEGDTFQLCLNEFATRASEFRESLFYRTFHDLGGVIDPLALADAGKIITCRAKIPRKDENVVCKALEEQTGVLYTTIRLQRYTYSVATRPIAKGQ